MNKLVEDFVFTEEEKLIIEAALATNKPWNYEPAEDIKKKIHRFHFHLTEKTCCYCQKNMHGEFKMVIDPEHILPSSVYKELSYTIWNLSVACKRCNMLIKKARTDFLNNEIEDQKNSAHYFFIHPNIDKYEDHLELEAFQRGKRRIFKYLINSQDKGKYTYEYFELSEIELNNYNKYQGIDTAPINSPVVMEVQKLAKTYNII